MSSSGERQRHAARLAAVQALYQMEITGIDADSVTEEFTALRFHRESEDDPEALDADFFSSIVHGVPSRQEEIDAEVRKCLAANWRLSRMDSILRAILRAGAYELISRPDVPAKVVIDEYLDLAREFLSENESPFVNAALDKLARRKRAAEFGETPPDDEF
jgi:N utilization substance protein B